MEYWKIALVVLLLVPLANAQTRSVDITFDLKTDSVVQTTTFFFDQPANGNISYILDRSAKDVEVYDRTGAVPYQLTNVQDGYVLSILLEKQTDQITLKYEISDIIFHSDSIEQFFTELAFDNIVNITAQAKLPEGYLVYQGSYRPATASIVSDGRRIILNWNLTSDDVLFSVKYAKPGQENSIWIAVIAVLAGSLLFVYMYFKQRRKEDILFGFRHDEKLTLNYIEQKKVALQSDLEHEFKFSRAKTTRIVSKLVEKGLVRKQRYGRTNKLTWIKS